VQDAGVVLAFELFHVKSHLVSQLFNQRVAKLVKRMAVAVFNQSVEHLDGLVLIEN
jgi:uncharacterized protein YpbB